jgi:hypothetical protein
LILNILPTLGIPPGSPAREKLREHLALLGRHAAKIETLETESPGFGVPPMRFENAFGVVPVLVVKRPLQRIAENLVSLCDELEMLFRRGIPRIDVRVIPAGQLSKSFLDVVFGSRSDDFKNNIKIARRTTLSRPYSASMTSPSGFPSNQNCRR